MKEKITLKLLKLKLNPIMGRSFKEEETSKHCKTKK